jgi:hypothetical protein
VTKADLVSERERAMAAENEIAKNIIGKADKTNTFTKAQIKALLRSIRKYDLVPVDELPEASEATRKKIYLVPHDDGEDDSLKDQYVTVASVIDDDFQGDLNNVTYLGDIYKDRLESVVKDLGTGMYIFNVLDTLTSTAYIHQVTLASQIGEEPTIPRKATTGLIAKDRDDNYYKVSDDGEWIDYAPPATYEWFFLGTMSIDFENYYTKQESDERFAPLVYIVPQTLTAVDVDPNTLYRWSSPVNALYISLNTPTNLNVANEYMLEFTVGSEDFHVECAGVRWIDGDAPDWEVGSTYQVSILNGLAVAAGWEAAG